MKGMESAPQPARKPRERKEHKREKTPPPAAEVLKPSWGGFMRKVARTLMLGTALFGASSARSLEGEAPRTGKTKAEKTTSWDFEWNLFRTNAQGKAEFDPIGAFNPNIKRVEQVSERGEVAVSVPFEYARKFSADPAAKTPPSPEQMQEMVAEANREGVQIAADLIEGRTPGSDVEYEQAQVTGIGPVVGFASPEARGPESVRKDSVEEENVALGRTRAETLLQALGQEKDALRGLTDQHLAAAEQMIEGRELDFTDAERDIVNGITAAARERGIIAASPIAEVELYRLYQAANTGKLPADLKGEWDSVIQSKRSVELALQYAGGRVETKRIPVPLYLLLPLLLLLVPRRKEEPKPPKPVPPVEPVVRPVPVVPKPVPAPVVPPPLPKKPEYPPFVIPDIPKKVRTAELPPEGSPDRQSMEDQALIMDLYVYFDSPAERARGLDYRAICEELETFENALSGQAEDFATLRILEMWQDKDSGSNDRRRQPQGSWLDYKDNEYQIRWARVHAKHLMRMAARRKQDPARDWQDILRDLTGERYLQIHGLEPRKPEPKPAVAEETKEAVAVAAALDDASRGKAGDAEKLNPELDKMAGRMEGDDFDPMAEYRRLSKLALERQNMLMGAQEMGAPKETIARLKKEFLAVEAARDAMHKGLRKE